MSETTAIEHERRLTRLEDRFEVFAREIAAKLERLEADAEQRRADKEQTERREMAEIRKKLAEAEATIRSAS